MNIDIKEFREEGFKGRGEFWEREIIWNYHKAQEEMLQSEKGFKGVRINMRMPGKLLCQGIAGTSLQWIIRKRKMRKNEENEGNVGEIKRSFFLATVLEFACYSISRVCLMWTCFSNHIECLRDRKTSVSTFQRQSKRTQREGYP